MFEALLFSNAVTVTVKSDELPKFEPAIVIVSLTTNPVPPLYIVTLGVDEPSVVTINKN